MEESIGNKGVTKNLEVNFNKPMNYKTQFSDENINKAYYGALDIIANVGIQIDHQEFLSMLKGKDKLTIKGNRVFIDRSYVEAQVEKERDLIYKKYKEPDVREKEKWGLYNGAWSMNTIDIDTEKIRLATCDDMRDYVRLCESYGCAGGPPVYPQDVPSVVMREIAAFKICYENSAGNIDAMFYSLPEQAPIIYDMAQVVGRSFNVIITIAQPLHMVSSDLENFLQFHKSNRKFKLAMMCYNLPGLTGPITPLGSAMLLMAEHWATSLIFKTIDESYYMGIVSPGVPLPIDFRNCCWAFGSPISHLTMYLKDQLKKWFGRMEKRVEYTPSGVFLGTSSSAIDYQAGVEKSTIALVSALQGAYTFDGLGNLCVDDLFSPVQFILDIETVEHIRQMVDSFTPPQEFFEVEGMYDVIVDVVEGKDSFISHETTALKARTLYPSSDIFVRQKLASFIADMRLAKDRAREFAREGMKKRPFVLPEDKQKDLDEIYNRALKQFS